MGRRRGQGTGAPLRAGHWPQRLPLLPFPAPRGLVSPSGDGGWGGTAEGREAGERSPWQSLGLPGGDWEEGARGRAGGQASRGRERGLALLACGGHADPQDACLSWRVVSCSRDGDRSARRVSGFLAHPLPQITPRKHML